MLCGSEGISLPRPSVIPSLGKPPLTHACFPCVFPPWGTSGRYYCPMVHHLWTNLSGPKPNDCDHTTDGRKWRHAMLFPDLGADKCLTHQSLIPPIIELKRLALGTIHFTVTRSHQFTSLSSTLPSRLALITTCFATLTCGSCHLLPPAPHAWFVRVVFRIGKAVFVCVFPLVRGLPRRLMRKGGAVLVNDAGQKCLLELEPNGKTDAHELFDTGLVGKSMRFPTYFVKREPSR